MDRATFIAKQENAEANAFACELLMPKEEFRQAIKEGCNTVEKLSNRFQVTCMAVMWNLERLNFVEKGHFGMGFTFPLTPEKYKWIIKDLK